MAVGKHAGYLKTSIDAVSSISTSCMAARHDADTKIVRQEVETRLLHSGTLAPQGLQ